MMMNKFENNLKYIKNEYIKPSLVEYFESLNPPAKILKESMQYSTLSGGNYFRSFLLYYLADIFNVSYNKIKKISVALELLQTYTLIHDDLPSMDNALTRRGKPCSHIQFGENIAILTGDALLGNAINLICTNTHITDDINNKIIAEISKMLGSDIIISGQVLDIDNKKPLSKEEYIQIIKLKTESFISIPFKVIATIAKIDSKQTNLLLQYSEHLGIMYQLIDDIHDKNIDEHSMPITFGEQTTKNYINKLSKESQNIIKLMHKLSSNDKMLSLNYINEYILSKLK